MNTSIIDPTTDALWHRLVDHTDSSVFHSPRWMRVLADSYGFDLRALVAVDESGEPRAGIPFGRISDFKGERIVSLPFSDYCDPLVGDAEEWRGLIDRLMAEGCPVTLRCLHNQVPLSDERFELANRAKWHGMELRPDLETLWSGLDGSARRAIKKAQQNGVVVRVAEREEELRAFFEMHLGVRKHKYRLLAQPYRFFENIWRHLVQQHQGFLLVALHQEEIIGGVMFLEWKDTLYYKFNASSPRHLSHRPNDFVIWNGIQMGKAKGFHRLDFGLSDWDQEELVRYKRKYASEEKTISFLRYEPNGGPTPREREARGLLSQLTELLVDESVPDSISDRAGDILYRYFV